MHWDYMRLVFRTATSQMDDVGCGTISMLFNDSKQHQQPHSNSGCEKSWGNWGQPKALSWGTSA